MGTGASRANLGDDSTVTVMTRNLYLGADLQRVRTATTDEDLRRTVHGLYDDVRESRFEVRARGIAEEIATHEPDVVGLQEVARFARIDDGRRSTELDYLTILKSELAERGLDYRVVATRTNADVEAPALDGGDSYRVRFVDRDVLLARDGVVTSNPRRYTYLASLGARGYCAVDVADAVTVVNTHLATDPFVQAMQALELVWGPIGDPTVLLGDFNSAPDDVGTFAYDLLTERGRFTDAVSTVGGDAAGPTCCHRKTLANDAPELRRRIDHVFTRDELEALAATRVGHEPHSRIEGQWPSDHAGVVATVGLP